LFRLKPPQKFLLRSSRTSTEIQNHQNTKGERRTIHSALAFFDLRACFRSSLKLGELA
jgi:hypothetical protein